MKKRAITIILAIAFPFFVLAVAVTSRAKVEIRNPATSNGTISFRFQPRGGVPTDITINIRKGWTSLRISREIADKLTSAMPRNYRATSRRHGVIDYVAVEKDVNSAANFTLTNTNITVEGTSVNVYETN